MKRYYVTVNGKKYEVEVEEVKGEFTKAEVNSAPAYKETSAEVKIQKEEESIERKTAKEEEVKTVQEPLRVSQKVEGEKIECPMPGNIVRVDVAPGSSVKKGEVLMVLEAMKMENEIMAPKDCKVISVNVVKGATVNTGDTLLVIE